MMTSCEFGFNYYLPINRASLCCTCTAYAYSLFIFYGALCQVFLRSVDNKFHCKTLKLKVRTCGYIMIGKAYRTVQQTRCTYVNVQQHRKAGAVHKGEMPKNTKVFTQIG